MAERFRLPAVYLDVAKDQSVPEEIGRTRLGGLPDLPPDVPWPRFRVPFDQDRNRPEFPMPFLFQLEVAEFRSWLPWMADVPDGLLLFFAAYWAGSGTVIHVAPSALDQMRSTGMECQRERLTSLQEHSHQGGEPWPPVASALAVHHAWSIPWYIGDLREEGAELPEDHYLYWHEYEEHRMDFRYDVAPSRLLRVGGYSEAIHSLGLELWRGEYVLLAQIAFDDDYFSGMNSRLYALQFVIAAEDLRAQRWSAVEVTIENGF